MGTFEVLDGRLKVAIFNHLIKSGFEQSAKTFDQEANLYQTKVPTPDLQEAWGFYADEYVPIPENMHQEAAQFEVLSRGERKLSNMRALRLNRFIVHYMKMNNLHASADIFDKETLLIEKTGDGDGLLENFWIPFMTEHHDPSTLDNPDLSFKEFFTVYKRESSRILTCDFSFDGKLLAYSGTRRELSIYNVETLSHLAVTPMLPHITKEVRFKPGSNVLATSCSDGIIRWWVITPNVNTHSGELHGHTSSVETLDFYPKDSNFLCSGDSKGGLHWWNMTSRLTIHMLMYGDGISQVRFSAKGNLLAVASGKNLMVLGIKIYDDQVEVTHVEYLEGHVQNIKSVCWGPTDTLLASVSRGDARVWRSKNKIWKCWNKLESGGDHPFHSCIFNPAHPQLLIIGSIIHVYMWDFVRRSKIRIFGMENPSLVYSLACSPESGFIATTSNEVTLWKAV